METDSLFQTHNEKRRGNNCTQAVSHHARHGSVHGSDGREKMEGEVQSITSHKNAFYH